MTDSDQHSLRAIVASAESVAELVLLGDLTGAKHALERAENRLALFTGGKPWHARVVRVARGAVEKARLALEAATSGRHTRTEKHSLARSASRACARARA